MKPLEPKMTPRVETLSFLDTHEQRELGLRIGHANTDVAREHRNDVGRIAQEHIDRGLMGSTVYTGAVAWSGIQFMRRFGARLRDEVFVMAHEKDRPLDDHQTQEIATLLREIMAAFHSWTLDQLRSAEENSQLTFSFKHQAARDAEAAIKREADDEVAIEAGSLKRQIAASRVHGRRDGKDQSAVPPQTTEEWTFAQAHNETGVPKAALTLAAKKQPHEPGYLPHRAIGRTKLVTKDHARAFAKNYDARRESRVLNVPAAARNSVSSQAQVAKSDRAK